MGSSAKMIVDCATQIGEVFVHTTTELSFSFDSTCSNGTPSESFRSAIENSGNYEVNGTDEPKCPSGETCASCDTGYAQSAVGEACDTCETNNVTAQEWNCADFACTLGGEATCGTCNTGYAQTTGGACDECATDYVDDGKGGCVGTASIVHSTSIGFVSLVIVMTAMGVLP